MKHCNTCNTTKELEEFYPKAASHDGRMSKCKECSKAAKRAWAKANREHLRSYENNYRADNEDYKEYQKAYMKKHQRVNKAYWNAKNAKHRADKLQQTPSWANLERIKGIYALAQYLTETYGREIHVDHEIPLNGKLVSGLHVEDNLQLLYAEDNLTKSNVWEIN